MSETTLPTGWTWTNFEDTCEVIMGQSPPSSTYNQDGIGLPFFQGKAEFGDLYPTPVKWCSKPNKIAEADDILISVRAPVGPTNLCREQSCIGRGLSAIRPKDEMGNLYFLYWLRYIESDWDSKSTGTTFKAISSKVLRSQEIPLPPLAEQHRIVAEIEKQLTRLDAGGTALHRAQARLQRYKAAVLKAACEGRLVPQNPDDESAVVLLERILTERREQWNGKGKYKEPQPPNIDSLLELPEGWVWSSLEQLAEFKNGINFNKDQRGSGVLTVDVLNMYSKSVYLDLSNLYRVDKEINDEYRLKYGDILFVRSSVKREGVGWASLFKEAQEPVTYCGFLIRARLQSAEIYPEYLGYFSRSNFARETLVSSSSQVTITNINQKALGRLQVPLPPLAEQQHIVAEVERRLSVVEEVEAVLTANLHRAGRLRQSILKQAFEGRLVAQDPADEPASVLLERIREERTGVEGKRGRQLELPGV